MRVYRSDGSVALASDIIPVAERVGMVRMLDFRALELVVADLATTPSLQRQRQRLAEFRDRPALVARSGRLVACQYRCGGTPDH